MPGLGGADVNGNANKPFELKDLAIFGKNNRGEER
jgi:hypothetical protein